MELLKKAKPFAQIMNHEEFDEFCKDLIGELNLRQEITKLQEWRHIKIVDLQGGEKYEQEKVVRQKAMPIGSLDLERFPSGRAKPALVVSRHLEPQLSLHLSCQSD
jgi:transcriptional adapter 2-alpha